MSGQLWIVGLGPGARDLMTAQTAEAIRAADVVIGYSGYFEGIADLVAGKECIALPLGEETERAALAIGHAREARRVCVISSGDAGIYGMASLVLETILAKIVLKERVDARRWAGALLVLGGVLLLAQ